MSMPESIKEHLKRMEFINKVSLALFIVSAIIFLMLWATIGFVLPAFLTDVRLFQKGFLFALWTIGAILSGVVIGIFIFTRGLRKAVRGK